MKYLSLSIRYVILFSVSISRVFGSTNSSDNLPRCHLDDSSALLRFKATFSENDSPCNAPSSHAASWIATKDCCEWDGIVCDADSGHVVDLFLSCVRLRRAITSNSSLFSLANLERLHLSLNDFRGSPILPEFGTQFKNLTKLQLFGSNFSGAIPLEIAHLTKLVSLTLVPPLPQGDKQISIGASTFSALARNTTGLKELTFIGVDMSTVSLASFANSSSSSLTTIRLLGCALNGRIPKTAFHFPKLEILELQGNNLHGIVPWSSLNLESLLNLDLSYNNFTGQLPKVYSNFSRKTSSTKYPVIPSGLIRFKLTDNMFDGTIPSWISEQPSLEVLAIRNNLFTGNLEIEKLSKLKELSQLSISSNNLSLIFNNSMNHTFENLEFLQLSSCNMREFPNFLESSNRLQMLDLSNNQMKGSLPKWFEELGKDSISYLNLSHNFLTSHSIELVHWKNLQYLDLSYNSFSGSLPIPSRSSLITFFASDNHFSGSIPTSICSFKSLVLLDLSDNNLSGNIPQCMGGFSEILSVFDLRNNKLQGVIPTNFSRANSLRSLNLNGNRLEGPLPRSLAYCKSLEVFDLANNLLNDTFPNWLETLPELRVLVLRANKFHGPIGITMISNPFPKLRIIDLSDHDFNGSLPLKYLENFEAMTNEENVKMEYMGGDNYRDSVVVTIKGNSVQMVKIQTIFTTIDLSNNNFTGTIPGFLERLKSLKNLNLSHNMIRGRIPPSLGNLSNLEGLDLSCNELVGKIPNQLVNINWLSFLNLSYNHLEGSIPHGRQFNTFNNNSYKGNLGLCGFPLSKSCDNDKVQHDEGADGDTRNGIALEWKVVMMGYASGGVIGISIGYMLLFTRTFDCWSMKRLERQSRRRSIQPTRGRR